MNKKDKQLVDKLNKLVQDYKKKKIKINMQIF